MQIEQPGDACDLFEISARLSALFHLQRFEPQLQSLDLPVQLFRSKTVNTTAINRDIPDRFVVVQIISAGC
jgi:hypothetical protein